MEALIHHRSSCLGRARSPVDHGMNYLLSILCAITITPPVLSLYEEQLQPGATQGGPTTGHEMMPAFDMRYFLGDGEVEWPPWTRRCYQVASTLESSGCGT